MSRNKTEVEESKILDINVFKSVCKKGNDSGEYRWWINEEPNGKIGYSIHMFDKQSGVLNISYTILSHSSSVEDKPYDYSINICATRCNYGGYRYWMKCPLLHNGIPCNRRVRKLYMASGCDYFGCRECLDLTYESKSKNYHRSQFRSFQRYFDYVELLAKTKTIYYNGRLTRSARRLQRIGINMNSVYSRLKDI